MNPVQSNLLRLFTAVGRPLLVSHVMWLGRVYRGQTRCIGAWWAYYSCYVAIEPSREGVGLHSLVVALPPRARRYAVALGT
jgi:hypothetical protein